MQFPPRLTNVNTVQQTFSPGIWIPIAAVLSVLFWHDIEHQSVGDVSQMSKEGLRKNTEKVIDDSGDKMYE